MEKFIVRNSDGIVVIKYPLFDEKVLCFNHGICDWECLDWKRVFNNSPSQFEYVLRKVEWVDIPVGGIYYYSDLDVEDGHYNMAEYCIKLSDKHYVFMLDDGQIQVSDVPQDYCYEICAE